MLLPFFLICFNRYPTHSLVGSPPAPNAVQSSLNSPNSRTPLVQNPLSPPHPAWLLLILEATTVGFLVLLFTPQTPPILLSHKVFGGICYLYITFIGSLILELFQHDPKFFASCFWLVPLSCRRRHPLVWPVCICYHWHWRVAATLWKLPQPDQPKGGFPTCQSWGRSCGRQGRRARRRRREGVLMYKVSLHYRSGRRDF